MQAFDYRMQAPADKPVREWRQEARETIASGGFRRCEHGETFIHGKDGKILIEIYGYVAVTKGNHDAD